MKLALFTDSHFLESDDGFFFPTRDQFPHFISPLSRYFGELIICSRCKTITKRIDELDIDCIDTHNSNIQFKKLPYYEDTEELYKNYLTLFPKTLKRLNTILTEADAIFLRMHHCFGWLITWLAEKKGLPLFIYWAGAPISEIVKHNYPSNSIKDVLARSMASFEHYLDHKILPYAQKNFFLEPNMYEILGKPANTEWVVPNLIQQEDIIDETPSVKKNDTLRLLYAGRIVRQKGVFDLLNTVQSMKGRRFNFKMIYAGGGPHLDELKFEVQKRNLQSVVNFKGHLTHAKLIQLMRQCHIFILPSYNEGLPKVLWEAWASGMSVIISDVGGVSKYVRHGKNGILITPGRDQEITDAILKLQSNKTLRKKIISSGIEAVRKHTWHQEISKIANLITNTVN